MTQQRSTSIRGRLYRTFRLPLVTMLSAVLTLGLYSGCGAGSADQTGEGGAAKLPGMPPGTNPGTGADGTGAAPGKSGADTCVAERVTVPSGQGCECECTDCLCTSIACTCDGTCYGAAECLVNSDSNGNATVGGGFGADCSQKSCVPEDDLTTELKCAFADCRFAPNQLQLQPREAPPDLDLERAVKNTGLIMTVDTSSSMTNKQAYSACAADAFIRATAGAEWSAGVMTQDITRVPGYQAGNGAGGAPPLLQVSGSCTPAASCSCGGNYTGDICRFSPGGSMISSKDPNALDALRRLVVQGSNEASDIDEAGLEKAFLYVMGLYREGRGAEVSQVVAISDEPADSDEKVCPIQSKRDIAGIQAVLGDGFQPPANTGNCSNDLIAFYSYFFEFVNVRVNALVATGEAGRIYTAVANATEGTVASLFECSAFEQFWNEVGATTTTLSTQLCFPNSVDPAATTLVYTENGANTEVPKSATEGWTYDAALRCIVLHGSWESKYGSFHVANVGNTGKPSGRTCFPSTVDPIPDTIKVSVGGAEVPRSTSDGFSYDAASRCIELHGSYASNPGPFDVEYL